MQRMLIILMVSICITLIHADEYKDGMKAYGQGRMEEALEMFIAKVTEKPDHQKSVDMIKQLLPKVVVLRTEKAKDYEEAGQWEKAQKEYDRLRRLDKVLQSLVVYDNKQQMEFPKIDVGEQQSEAIDKAAEKYYLHGVEEMKTIGNAEQAVEYFKEARKFDPDYKDAKELSAQALYNDGMALINDGKFKEAVHILWKTRDFFPEGFKDTEQHIQTAIDSAKVKIAVMSFEDLTFRIKYGDIGSSLSSEIIAVGVGQRPIFIDFVTRDYVHTLLSEQDFGASGAVDASTASRIGKVIGIDVFIFGKITAINQHYPKDRAENGESAAEITSLNGQKRYVYAKWTKHTRTGQVTVTANYQIVDVTTGRIVDSNSISKTLYSTAQWVTYSGDEEALERSVLAHNTTGDVAVLPSEILASDAMRQISNVIAASILKNYE